MIQCKGCGLCCMWVSKPPFGDDEKKPDIEIVPNAYNSPCCWLDLDTRECRHYEHRPELCKKFERGGKDCLGLIEIEMKQRS